MLAADFTLQLLHASDFEAGLAAVQDAPNFAAVVQALEDDFANTIIVASGDNYIPGPFFNAGGDPALNAVLGGAGAASVGRADIEILNRIGVQASAFGNHEFDAGPREVRNIIRPAGSWRGARFPYLSSNLDFSGDPDLGPAVIAGGQNAATSAGRIAPSTVILVGGESIGIVGVTTPMLPNISSPGPGIVVRPANPGDLTALAAIVQPAIDALEAAGIDKIIVASHLQQIGLEQSLAPLLSGVDIIMAGGSNTRLVDATDRLRAGDQAQGAYPILTTNADGQPLAIVNTDGNYRYVGRLVVGFDAAGVLDPATIDPAVSGAYATDDQGVQALWGDLTAPFAAGTKGAAVREVAQAIGGVINAKDAARFGRSNVYLNGLRAEVRTQETNLGNLTADANLAAGRAVDPTVRVSLKNGGGIRDSVGAIDPASGARQRTAANASAGKAAGDVSRLDIENSLRFNNQLSLVTVSARDLWRTLEHAVAATAPGATPGQFPQVGGLAFSFDPARPAIRLAGDTATRTATVVAEGQRVRNLTIVDESGNPLDVILRDGQLVGDPSRPIRSVTLSFLSDNAGNGLGGDSYPLPTFGSNVVSLGRGEQAALSDFLGAAFPLNGTPFRQPDTGPEQDRRVQNLALRDDAVPDAALRLLPVGSIAAGAEIAAYDPGTRRVFVTSGSSLEVLDVADPSNPTRIATADLSIFGGNVSSVAVNGGLVAATVIAATKTDPGRVVFLDATGTVLGSLVVGAQPDMLTFTPDGARILVANEGEAATISNPASTNPEGSVGVITLDRNNLGASTVQTAGFTAFNAQRAALVASGVRIFAAAPSVAQDLEPEYIAIAPGGATALVTLQEANAVAIVDIATATVTEIRPLGLKDYGRDSTSLETYTFANLPTIGTTAAGQAIPLGGFSGLFYEGVNAATGNLRFLTHTDRGPNAEPINVDADPAVERPFALPAFQPELVRFELDRRTGALTVTGRVGLTRQDGTPLTGLPNLRTGTSDNAAVNDEEPIDLFGNPVALDPLGADLEGIAVAADGTLWAVDEYRPAIYHFDAAGRLIERIVPQGTAAAAGQPAGIFGTEALPSILGRRRANRGFEAVAIQDGRIYSFVQSTIRNPTTLTNGNLNLLRNVRIVEYNPANGQTRQFLYVQDAGSDKIGDAAALGNGEFLVIERDDDSVSTAGSPAIDKKVYRFSLAGATDVSALNDPINGLTIDQMTPAQLAAAGVVPVAKALRADLAAAGYDRVEKVEGLAVIDAETIVVINDDDFGLEGTFDRTTGRLTTNPSPEPILLGIIHIQSVGLDASDQDGGINIRPAPVFGLYMPDGIASFSSGGQTYYITANEGDTRDEERRIGASSFPALDATAYPNASALRQPAALGRLNASPLDGDLDGDGDIDRLTVYGGRSFSILDAAGRLVYESGDLLERLTAGLAPNLFNANDGDPARFDTRSDDKGPEPENVVVGAFGGRIYAFIALERGPSGVIVFDVTVPVDPEFVGLFGRAGDVSPEGLAFVSAADSPNGRPLLIVANEGSNTVTLYQALDVTAANDAPGAAGDRFAVDEDAVLSVPARGVLGNDLDPDGDVLTAVLVDGPTGGTLALAADGSFVYTPRPNFSGADRFTYRASDGALRSDVATVILTVTSVDNDPPVAVDDAYATVAGSVRVAAPGLLANDFDPEGDPISIAALFQPANGTVEGGTDGSFTYRPNAGFVGTDIFTYRTSSPGFESNLAIVRITVAPVVAPPGPGPGPAPVAAADAYETVEDGTLRIAAPGVLANDSNPLPGGTPIAALVSGTLNGTLALAADGSFTYTPAAGFRGADSFRYRLDDGAGGGPVATVTIAVGAAIIPPVPIIDVNDPPVALGRVVFATAGVALQDVAVATFTDVDTASASAFAATIDWGDGTPATPGTIVAGAGLPFPGGPTAFEVRGGHTYAASGTYRITVTIAESGASPVTAGAAAVVAFPTGTPLAASLDLGSDGGRTGDGITNASRPTFAGTAPVGSLVSVVATSAAGGAASVIGRAIAGPDGTFLLTANPMADGAYLLVLSAADPSRPEAPFATADLGRLVVDTTAPRVSGVRLDPRTGRILVTFIDELSGLAAEAVTRPAGFVVRRPFDATANPVAITDVSTDGGATDSGTRTVTLRLGRGRRLFRARYVLRIIPGPIQDAAGNALDGEFLGTFPAGDGRAGGVFRARLDVRGGRASAPRRVILAPVDDGGSRSAQVGSVPAGPLGSRRAAGRRR